MVTLGGNGKRDGHVRVPPYDRGRCIVYVQAGRSEFIFLSSHRASGTTRSGLFTGCSMSYDWMRNTAWAQKVQVHCGVLRCFLCVKGLGGFVVSERPVRPGGERSMVGFLAGGK